jgi:hypothetical protein
MKKHSCKVQEFLYYRITCHVNIVLQISKYVWKDKNVVFMNTILAVLFMFITYVCPGIDMFQISPGICTLYLGLLHFCFSPYDELS